MNESSLPPNEGFEIETGAEGAPLQVPGERREKQQPRQTRWDMAKANVAAVFGHGVGRASIIAVAAVFLLFMALGIRGCTHKPNPAANAAKVDVPSAPTADVSVKPVSAQEAQRHAAVSQQEAQEARDEGRSYQASFDPRIAQEKAAAQSQGQGAAPPQNGAQPTTNTPNTNQQPAGQTPQQTQAEIDAEKQRQAAYDKAVAERDAYVDKNAQRVTDEVDEILGTGKFAGQQAGAKSGYRTFSYYTEKAETQQPAGQGGATTAAAAAGTESKAAPSTQKGPPLIKTGNRIYATLNSQLNTDHGNKVLMTVAGGPWDGAQLIGALEQTPDNVMIHLTTLAPQDDRQTLKIDAVALREQDLSFGAAEKIDHHTLSRYTALAASSLLQGYGEAYSYTAGTSTITGSGTVVQTAEEPSTKQVVGRSVGQMGTALASEVQKGFNRPTTFSTPAERGYIIYFMADVYPTSN